MFYLFHSLNSLKNTKIFCVEIPLQESNKIPPGLASSRTLKSKKRYTTYSNNNLERNELR